MNDYKVTWESSCDVRIEGRMCFGTTISKFVSCHIDEAIKIAKLILETFEHHGLEKLDIFDIHTGEVYCSIKR